MSTTSNSWAVSETTSPPSVMMTLCRQQQGRAPENARPITWRAYRRRPGGCFAGCPGRSPARRGRG
uniref:Uncharacterized protein n=1 Tax=Human herpesvirus 2 TaxID=10310 RepID=A0A481TCW4_HHV2|nr:hypothetical protein [Human alphaherpesvirus 2]